MGRVSFWRTSPPQPKKSKKAKRLERLRPKGTLIRQRKDGGLWFSTKDPNGQFRGWTIDAAGVNWLSSLGIKPGERVQGQIIHDMINKGLARPRTIEKPSSTKTSAPKTRKKRNPLEKLITDTRRWEKRRAEENARLLEPGRKVAVDTQKAN